MKASLGPAFFRDEFRRLWAEYQALEDREEEQARERSRLKVLWAIQHQDPEITRQAIWSEPGQDKHAHVGALARFQQWLFEDPDWHDAEPPLRLEE